MRRALTERLASGAGNLALRTDADVDVLMAILSPALDDPTLLSGNVSQAGVSAGGSTGARSAAAGSERGPLGEQPEDGEALRHNPTEEAEVRDALDAALGGIPQETTSRWNPSPRKPP